MAGTLFKYYIMLVVVYRVQTDRRTFNESQVEELQGIMDLHCSGHPSVVCNGDMSGGDAWRNGTSACCSGCSCSNTCGLIGNCCYKEDDLYQLTDKGIMRCMYPNTRYSNDWLTMMYTFIVGAPDGGCLSQAQCNKSQPIIPWKTFHPVFSRSKKMSYITKECAQCHGVTDAVEWESRLVFNSFVPLNLADVFDMLFDGMSNRIYVSFSHPGNAFETTQGICSTDIREECLLPRDYTYKSVISQRRNGSYDTIRNGCIEGPRSPILYHGRMYKNIYCVYCDQYRVDENCASPHEKGSLDESLIAILDSGFVNTIGRNDREKDDRNNRPLACKDRVPGSCRPVLCPSMKLRHSDGTCVNPSYSWFPDRLLLLLNLTTVFDGHVDELFGNLSDTDLLDTFYKVSPWHNCWHIDKIGSRSYLIGGKQILEVVLQMHCEVYKTDPERLLSSIKTTMRKKWSPETNVGILSMDQGFLKHILFSAMVAGRRVFVTSYYMDSVQRGKATALHLNTTEAMVRKMSAPIWNAELFANAGSFRPLVINKLFFCSQVEIQPNEYTLAFQDRVLALQSPQKYLFSNEFSLSIMPTTIGRVIGVCLEDSGFEVVRNTASTIDQLRKWKMTDLLQWLLIFSGLRTILNNC